MKIFDNLPRPRNLFKPGREAAVYIVVMLCFGLAFGCFYGVLNNYLAEEAGINEKGRGVLEFFREMPGLFLMAILALLARRDEWWILRFGLVVAVVGLAGLFFAPPQIAVVTLFVVLWSLGEHVLMPVRSSITLHLAKPGQEGGALGLLGGLSSLGHVAGSLVVVGIFYGVKNAGWLPRTGFDVAFALVFALLLAALGVSLLAKGKGEHVRRPKFYVHRKYNKFYILEVFYGARKQIFITFAPFMLIKLYGMDTARFALLAGICAAANIFCAPLAGWIVDRLGYRTVMIWDTIFLIAVCLLYGFAYQMFSFDAAFWVVCANFILDALITNASMATNIYIKGISGSREELTATLSTGISVNHLISIVCALAGGSLVAMVCARHGFTADGMKEALAVADPAAKRALANGYGVLFSISAFMALMNTLFALTIPKPAKAA